MFFSTYYKGQLCETKMCSKCVAVENVLQFKMCCGSKCVAVQKVLRFKMCCSWKRLNLSWQLPGLDVSRVLLFMVIVFLYGPARNWIPEDRIYYHWKEYDRSMCHCPSRISFARSWMTKGRIYYHWKESDRTMSPLSSYCIFLFIYLRRFCLNGFFMRKQGR